MNTPYETMFLMPPAIGEEQVDGFISRLKESVEKKRGEVTVIEKMGVRKTAYAVNKLNSAYYVLFQYKGTGETISEVERLLKNSDEVLKYLSTKVTTKAAPVVKPKAAPAEAAPAEVAAAPAAAERTEE